MPDTTTPTIDLPIWPRYGGVGPIERSILHELDEQERLIALAEAQRTIRERRGRVARSRGSA